MKEIIFVVGGCRSGKSRHALELAQQMDGTRKIFIATCIPYDEEMRQRVEKHKAERGKNWVALEVPADIGKAVTEHSPNADVILIDCLTLWISNLLMETEKEERILEYIRNLTECLNKSECPVILVSNEVGCGIVPENRLARLFRDFAGTANQKVAACADQVIWTVAGIPVTVKHAR